MQKQILILGGYGGVGSVLASCLLQYTTVDISIAGPHLEKAETLASQLRQTFPDRPIRAVYADARQKESLLHAFKGIDLVIVTATVADYMDDIAGAALDNGADMIDILFRSDVPACLEQYRGRVESDQRIFISQAGFHPGLPAPFIRYARNQFDRYDTANIGAVMNALFEKPESTQELFEEMGDYKSMILKNGVWKKGGYLDTLKVRFSERFGSRYCYPMEMREIFPLQQELGIQNMGVYVAGFNFFVDNVVFPISMMLQFFKKGLGNKTMERWMYWGVKTFFDGKPGVEFKLEAKGIKDGKEKSYNLLASCDDPYAFTAIPVTACVLQYLDRTISKSGLYLMGNVVDPEKLMADMRQMGVKIEEQTKPLT